MDMLDERAKGTHMRSANETRAEIRILVVDHHQVAAEGLARILERERGFIVLGAAGTNADAIQLALELEPDVIVAVDNLPDGSISDLANGIRTSTDPIPTVVLSIDEGDAALMLAVEAGAHAFIQKSVTVSKLIEIVRRAAGGEMLIPTEALVRLLASTRSLREGEADRLASVEPLTAREKEVLQLMAQGLDNRAVAEQLVLSYSSVRTHVQSTLEKLGAHSKLEAVARAMQCGLVPASFSKN
jgi:DNA-binding NarL/FixJ family response regulator